MKKFSLLITFLILFPFNSFAVDGKGKLQLSEQAVNSFIRYIKGDSSKVAIRVTSHMVCKKLCQYSNSALISTSANISGQEPLKIFNKVKKEFNGKIDFIVNGVVGGYNKPTQIIDLLTEDVIRKS